MLSLGTIKSIRFFTHAYNVVAVESCMCRWAKADRALEKCFHLPPTYSTSKLLIPHFSDGRNLSTVIGAYLIRCLCSRWCPMAGWTATTKLYTVQSWASPRLWDNLVDWTWDLVDRRTNNWKKRRSNEADAVNSLIGSHQRFMLRWNFSSCSLAGNRRPKTVSDHERITSPRRLTDRRISFPLIKSHTHMHVYIIYTQHRTTSFLLFYKWAGQVRIAVDSDHHDACART